MSSKFLLLLGASGVGKSAIIKKLLCLDERFCYVCPDITRPLRCNETDKREVSSAEMDEKKLRGEYIVVNALFGIRYATPRQPIIQALQTGHFPVLDWPVSRMNVMVENFFSRLYTVYVAPPSIDELKNRLSKDGRDLDGSRIANAEDELQRYWLGEFNNVIDSHVVSKTDKIDETVNQIYELFILATKE
jgi:guanylate kinase